MIRTELARAARISSTNVGRLMNAPNMNADTATEKMVRSVLRRLRSRFRNISGQSFIDKKSIPPPIGYTEPASAKLAATPVASPRIKSPALRPGDTVAVVAPAAAIERSYLERGVNVLSAMGFRVKVSERVLDRAGILAGTDQERAAELQASFADDSVRAIFAARGGYGCGRILPLLDFESIARAPKPFVGFSDETFILNALVHRSGIVSFHGPMVAMDFARGLSERSADHLRRLLCGEVQSFDLEARETVRPGTADGELIGGCLSVVVAMLATPYAPD